jgi:translation initiation factor IF-2
MRSRQGEKITLEPDPLDPIDDLEPEENAETSSTDDDTAEKEAPEAALEPQDDDAPAEKAEAKAEPEIEPEEKEEKADPEDALEPEEKKSESLEKKKASEEKAETKSSDEEDSASDENKKEAAPEKEVAEEESPDKKEKETAKPAAKAPDKEEEKKKDDSDDEEDQDEESDHEVDDDTDDDSDDQEHHTDEDEGEEDSDDDDSEEDDDDDDVEDDSEEEDDDDDEDDSEEESDDEESSDEPKETIRANRNKLRGTRVLGKMKVPAEDKGKKGKKKKSSKKDDKSDDSKPRKKRKRRIKRSKSDDSSKSKGAKKTSRRKSVDEEDVEKKMKETMQIMQGSGAAGKKRSKIRRRKREEMEAEREEEDALKELEAEILEVTEFITVSDLAELLDVNVNKVITTCMNLGMMVSINQRLEASTIELVVDEFGKEAKFVDAEELMEEPIEEEEDDPEDLEPRAPVVTIMGHVDHGKTSLLDYIRKTKVASGEAGGITQHIGAYAVKTDDGRQVTFLDTPGHEAFTAMRARGAQATDIVILVVAADDSVMPQTIEAINHAQAAGVPIVVAINKMDKDGADPQRIRQQLTEHNVIVEDYGGSVQVGEVSAHTGLGIDEMLEKVLIEAELLELKANPDRNASGTVVEARKDKGKGVVATVLVQRGTLHIGDAFVAGQYFGRVRSMENELGERTNEAGPSTPVAITGFDGVPQAGDKLISIADERKAKDIAQERQQIKREQSMRMVKHMTLDDLSRRLALGEVSELNIIIKGDVDGSIEAISGSLQKLSNEEVAVKIIHTGVGAITESDVLLASASDAIIIGFQVRPSNNARKLAEQEEIDIRLFSVIYDAVDEVHDALEGLLSPEVKESILGNVEVRDIFKVPNVGTVAGCYVTDGKVNRNNKIRLIRDGIVIYEGEIDSLKRFKDDVKEVASGYECGLSIKNFNDIKVGDVVESFELIETKRTLS